LLLTGGNALWVLLLLRWQQWLASCPAIAADRQPLPDDAADKFLPRPPVLLLLQ
jgi:hypothetical protein